MHKPCTIKCNDGSFNKNSKGPNGLNADILSKVHRALGNKKTINNVHSRTTRRTKQDVNKNANNRTQDANKNETRCKQKCK